ncbi:hypothetical protein, partial [Salmonella enterica]|uniref:hypothetical protein n=1 Tax=Salmonella enterica TaxID=28901 RepID=UPI0020CA80B2
AMDVCPNKESKKKEVAIFLLIFIRIPFILINLSIKSMSQHTGNLRQRVFFCQGSAWYGFIHSFGGQYMDVSDPHQI